MPLPVRVPSVVRLTKTDKGYQLIRNGDPYFIKGAGGRDRLEDLVQAGGNSIRTWGADNKGALLDKAHSLGLTVTIGMWIGLERHGFNYDDEAAVAAQFEQAKGFILQYKDHPALLMWAVGNEMEGDGYNPKVWKAVNEIAQLAKELDPNHPTMTVVAEVPEINVRNLEEYCPDIDIVGLNVYGGAKSSVARYLEAGGTKAVVLTEFGPPGQWESDKTSWGAPREMSSTQKATWYREVYKSAIENHPDVCLGSYVFLWGFKQEATATWYGMFLEDGARLATIETMTDVWGGAPSANACPVIGDIQVDLEEGLAPGAEVSASVEASDPDGDELTFEWVLQRESGTYEAGGDAQPGQPVYPAATVSQSGNKVTVRMPDIRQGYRLFAYVHDNNGNAAVANRPLVVEDQFSYPEGEQVNVPLIVYGDDQQQERFAASGYMGNIDAISMDSASQVQPQSGATCLEVLYDAGGNWGGVVWQSPANDWGDEPGGYDLSGADRLTFWARGADGGEVVSFGVGLLGRDKDYPDSARAKLADVQLTSEWTQYTIPLTGQDVSHIKCGFYWTLGGQGKPLTFYLDDILFE